MFANVVFFSFRPCSSLPSGVVAVLALHHYMQVLCTNSVFFVFISNVSQPWLHWDFFTNTISGVSIPYPEWSFMFLPLLMFLMICSQSLRSWSFMLMCLIWNPGFTVAQSQERESGLQYLFIPRNQKRAFRLCNFFTRVIYLKQQTSCLQNTAGRGELFCCPVSRLLWCNNRAEIITPIVLLKCIKLKSDKVNKEDNIAQVLLGIW